MRAVSLSKRVPLVLFLLAACGGGSGDGTPPVSDAGATSGAGGSAVVHPSSSGGTLTGSGGTTGTSKGNVDAADAPSGPSAVTLLDHVRVAGSNGGKDQHAQAPLDLGAGPFAKVSLTVDLDTTCFPPERSKDDPPPAGQNYPTKCDAYDRRFEISLDPAKAAGDAPGIELAHAITPFGGPMHFEVDITDVVNGLPGKHTLEAYIDTWADPTGKQSGSDGGWFVSASVTAEAGPAPRDVRAVIPIYYDSQKVPDVAPMKFTLPPETSQVRIEYRSTGHTLASGPTDPDCNGPPEEFCKRTHTISFDGKTVDEFVPYRDDCSSQCTVAMLNGRSYCMQNPFGALASVRAPRANWCPGTVSEPRVLQAAMSGGEHNVSWHVSNIESGGIWRTSAVVFAYK